MSDSVGVFVPILQSAADNLKFSLDEDKRKHNALQSAPNVSASNHSGMESLVEDDDEIADNTDLAEEKTEIVEYSRPNKESVVPVPSTTSVRSVTPSPSVSTSTFSPPIKSVPSSTELADSKHSPPKTRLHSHIIARTPSSSSSKKSKTIKHTASNESSWMSTISDFIPISMATLGSILLLVFTIYMTITWFKSGTVVIDKANNYLRINASESKPSMKQLPHTKQSISRSVYLRDLNEGFLKNSLLPPYAGSVR